mgnify:CR=1 FL=1
MRNNEDRLGTKNKASSPAATTQPTPQGGLAPLDFVRPTTILSLPSGGKFYPEGHPLRSGTIEMKYMTAKEEDILTSQTPVGGRSSSLSAYIFAHHDTNANIVPKITPSSADKTHHSE